MTAVTVWKQQGAELWNTEWSALMEAVKILGQQVSHRSSIKNYSNGRQMLGGSQQSAPRLKYKRRRRKFWGYSWVL